MLRRAMGKTLPLEGLTIEGESEHEGRRAQILDAFEEAVAAHGLESASFARVGEIAGVHRTLVRYHFGNRAGLVRAAVERIRGKYQRMLATAVAELPSKERLAAVLDQLFARTQEGEQTEVNRVLDALFSAAAHSDEVRAMLSELYDWFLAVFEDEIAAAYPKTTQRDVDRTALAVVALAMGRLSLDGLGIRSARHAARRACDVLLESLAEPAAVAAPVRHSSGVREIDVRPFAERELATGSGD